MEPYAVYLLRRFDAGETADQLAASEGIPRDRILIRLKAAATYMEMRKARGLSTGPEIRPELHA